MKPNDTAILFTNALAIDDRGWAQLAPFGDFPGQALVHRTDGSLAKTDAIQRFDREATHAMSAKFKSPWQRLKRYFTGCPIYVGHPDVPAFANEYPDKSPKGIIVDLQVRDDGLYCRPVFTEEGSELVENRRLRAFSAYWTAQEVGSQPGDSHSLKIYRPDTLKSAGLTNHPNLLVHLLNERQQEPPSLQYSTSHSSVPPMNKHILADFLAAQGITIANEAPDEQFIAALAQLADRANTAETALATRILQLETSAAELANERQFHADALLDRAITSGCITPAQRDDWANKFTADFANTATALAQLPPTLKTHAITQHHGARKAEIANISDRRATLDALVKTEMALNGGDYDRAFATVQKSNPALFSAMRQPAVS